MAVSPVSFSKTPQARDDRYANQLTEDSLQAVFDVLGNDLGGAARRLYSLDDGDNDRDLLGRDTARSAAASRDFSAKGAKIWITEDGKVGYDARSLGTRLQALAVGDTFEDSFTYAVQMANGTISVARVTVVIAGTNDAPEITSASQVTGSVHEDTAPAATGRVAATDVDNGDVLRYGLPDGGAGTYGTFEVDAATGEWAYRLHDGADHVQALAQGESHVEAFTVRVTDSFGAGAQQVVRITVTGTNDGPQITSGEQAGATVEDVSAGAAGRVTASDVDNGDRLAFAIQDAGAGRYGALAIDPDTGAWSYALDDARAAVQALAEGEVQVDRFTVRVSDAFGAGAEQVVTVSVTGTNDAPVIVSPTQVGAVREDLLTSTGGQVAATDVDNGDRLLYSLPDGGRGTYGSLAIDAATGAWTYRLDNAAGHVQALAQGETHVERFTVRVTDLFGASAEQVVEVTVAGTNDGPQITSGEQVGATTEDVSGFAAGRVTAGDVDNGDRLAFALPDAGAGRYGSLAIDPDTGAWTYALDGARAQVQALAEGEVQLDRFTVRVSDAFGAWAEQVVTVSVTGSNDAPVAVADHAAIDEDSVLLLDVLANDTDVDHGHGFVLLGAWVGSGSGSVAITGSGLAFDPRADFDALNVGHAATAVVTYRMADEHGAASDATATIVVSGRNDAPVVAAALASSTNEDAPAYAIDLLAGASDVDDGAMLSVAGVTEVNGKGGWTLAGNLITIDPDHFGEGLDDGEFEHLLFTYQVVDEHGAGVAQTLAVSVEGITDAPSLEVVTSAGARVNEVMLAITSQPARNERVALTFGELPDGARVFDAMTGQDVTAGLPDYLGTRLFKLVLAPDVDEFDDLSIAATGYRADGSAIAATVRGVDLAYDVAESSQTLNFSSDNQNIWGDFPGYIEFHEYVPFVGGTPMVWDAGTESWVDVPADPWRSGKFGLVDVQLDTNRIVAVAQQQAQGTLNAAKAVFEATAYVIDAGVQATFNTAREVYQAAEYTFWYVARGVDQAVRDTFKAAQDAYAWAQGRYNDAWYVFDVVAKGIYNTAAKAYQGFMDYYNSFHPDWRWLNDGAKLIADGLWDLAEKAYAGATKAWKDVKTWFDDTATAIYNEAVRIYNEAAGAVEQAAIDTFEAAKSAFAEAARIYNEAKAWVFNQANEVYSGVQKFVNDTLAQIGSSVDFNAQVTVQAEVFAQAGLQVDVVLDLGSVDTSIDYDLTSTTRYNQTTDMLVITPVMQNLTTGEAVAFETISPNARFYVVLHHDAGADFDVFVDGHLRVSGSTWYDLTPGSNQPLDLGATISPRTAVADIQALLAGLGGLDLGEDLDVGKLVLVDFDSTELEPFEVPLVGTLTEDVVSITLQFPTVQTQGTQAAYSPAFFQEGGLVAVDFSEISSAILNLVNARLDYSPELKQKIPAVGSLQQMENFDQLVESFLQLFMGTLKDVLDGQAEEVPVFLLDGTDQTNTSLLHFNLWPDSLATDTLDGNTASFGFYAAYGESAPVVHINFDVDQAISFIVNEIVKAAVNVATSGSATSVLAAIPTINPMDLTLGLDTILKVLQLDQASRELIGKFFDLNLNFQAADVDAHATAKFSQRFSLSIDDMSYRVTLEDGTSHTFTAKGAGELQIADARSHDANGDGRVDYALDIVPTAMFSNDTELGLGVGYTLDFLKGSLGAGIKLPLGELLGINADWLGVEIPLVDVALGPLLRVQGDLDVLDIDVFETRYELDVGSAQVDGTVDLALVGFNVPLADG